MPALRKLRRRGRAGPAGTQVLRFARGLEAAFVFLVALAVNQTAILWLDNVHIATTNGLYKSLQAGPWIADFWTARLDASNYLYFPLQGLSCKLLDALGIWKGVAWKQFAVLNGFWAAVAVTIVYLFMARLTGRVLPALLAALFHLGCGYFLLLGVISEDIMPGYTIVLGAMALAALWFGQPTVWRALGVGVLFTLGWLVEWRLMFPTLPALVLALMIARWPLRSRLAAIATLLVAIVATAGLASAISTGHPGAMGLHDLLYTGKAIGTGWAGLAPIKLWGLMAGVGNYFLLIMLDQHPGMARDAALALLLPVLLELAILAVSALVMWARRDEPVIRATAVVFLGTFGAGLVFNFYSQPADPQMQLNVMPWLTVAWGLIVASSRWPIILAALSLAPLGLNLAKLGEYRGGDGRWTGALAAIEKTMPTDTTVFLYWGMEEVVTWQYAFWGKTWDWGQAGPPPNAPAATPKFKWISANSGAMHHPRWSAAEHAADLKRTIDAAFDKGYRVVVADIWNWNEQEWAGHLGLFSAPERAAALHTMLHTAYDAEPLLTEPTAGRYYVLKRR